MKVFHIILLMITSLLNIQTQDLKVMSYNIRYDNPNDGEDCWDKRKGSVVSLLSYYQPIVFGIQEGLHHQVTYLDNSLANYSYVGVGRKDAKTQGEYSAIFYDTAQLKLLKKGTFWLSETSEKPSVGWDAALERICTYGLFEHQASGKQFWAFNTHFDHKGAKARRNSARLIVDKINTLNTENLPVVLMGDFNLLPISKPVRYLKKQLKDGKRHTQKKFYGPSGTFNGFKSKSKLLMRIDYIFVRAFQVQSYAHIDDKTQENRWISDHLPVFCALSFPK